VFNYAQNFFTPGKERINNEDNGGSDGGGFDGNDDDDNGEKCGDDGFADSDVFDDAMVRLMMMVKTNILMIRC
jgi:hypothetical protein